MTQTNKLLNRAVVVGALGYFVDIYDLLLFSIVRVSSLKSLGLTDEQILVDGMKLLDWQMWGLLIGGLLWGILGDRRGRVSVLFGSIAIYSIANLANAFVTNVEQYAWLRLIAGIGLAGELGAAVTLVSEVMTKETRGLGTMIIATIGVLGAILAALIGEFFDWRTAYFIGGILGLMLLVLRIRMSDSEMFTKQSVQNKRQGDIRLLFYPPKRFFTYLLCILVGSPIWFIAGILIAFSPELTKELGITSPISAGRAVLFSYIGLAIGDLASGYLSYYFKSRKKIMVGFLVLLGASIGLYINAHGWSETEFYALTVLLGIGAGYWALFVTSAAEQFGTNIRATVTTTVPNFVRGMVPLITFSFRSLSESFGLLGAAGIVGAVMIIVAIGAALLMKESYDQDLDYIET